MPLTAKGKKILANMKKQYGPDAESIFYASINKGTIRDVEDKHEGLKRKRPSARKK